MASGLCPTPSWLPCKSAFCIASQDCCPSDGFQREREVPSQPQRDIGRMACPEQAKLDGAWGKRLGAEGWGRYFGIFLAPCFGCVGPRCTGSLHDDQHYSEPSPSTSRSRLVCCGEISHRCRLRASFPKLWERGSFLCHAAKMSVEVCWLGEQHGKSGVDRCFGWCNQWISDFILKHPIFDLTDLVRCFEASCLKLFPKVPLPFKECFP